MKCGARVAIGVAAGYFLGRTKKMKLALMLGGMAAGRRAGGPGELLGRGAKLLESNAELAALRDQVQGRLVEAGKGAVLAVATRQIESLSDRVAQRVERLADPGRVGGLRDVVDGATGRSASGGREDAGRAEATDEGSVETEPAGDGREEPAERGGGERGSGRTAESRPADRERSAAGGSGRGAGNRETRSAANPRRAAGTAASGARAGARAATGRVRRGTRGER
jgi:hypothetical protein